ncbi:MAG TPA: SsrA-binding protein SmpB [Fimbriimonadaceae bacterium]|nr:SsrA-binding protein SmpB [Fimbriimonadaceae bacterium]
MAKKGSKDQRPDAPRVIQNRRARYDYEFLSTFEAGIVLAGSEVKSLWLGRAHLTDAYCVVKNGEMWVLNMDIEPYEHSSHFQPERRRDRKLLLHRREIELIDRRSMEKGLTIVPTKVYFNHGKAKLEIALARGKRQYDKREQLAKDEARRDMERARNLRE